MAARSNAAVRYAIPAWRTPALVVTTESNFNPTNCQRIRLSRVDATGLTGRWSGRERRIVGRIVLGAAGRPRIESGAALATVVGVLVEVPVMLAVVHVVNRSHGWYERARAV